MQDEIGITTEDNPFNPFTEFESWLSYDIQMGYYTCERLGSIVGNLPNSLTTEENNYFVESAIDQLVKDGCYNKNGKFVEYIKIKKNEITNKQPSKAQ